MTTIIVLFSLISLLLVVPALMTHTNGKTHPVDLMAGDEGED